MKKVRPMRHLRASSYWTNQEKIARWFFGGKNFLFFGRNRPIVFNGCNLKFPPFLSATLAVYTLHFCLAFGFGTCPAPRFLTGLANEWQDFLWFNGKQSSETFLRSDDRDPLPTTQKKKAWSSAAAAESLAISIDEARARAQEKRRNPASTQERSIQIMKKPRWSSRPDRLILEIFFFFFLHLKKNKIRWVTGWWMNLFAGGSSSISEKFAHFRRISSRL